ncbi:MAG: cell envelope biogenesis protein LolA [Prevotella sp.]|jgi:outer membrane lipoprotein-sorting protein|nr:cell envelope biogenesis protein LolA [Prevotella sp.]
MKRYLLIGLSFVIYTFSLSSAHAESAKSILDKAAATVSNPGGVQANFEMRSKQFGNTSGSISIKGRKFHATTPQATIWFDGKTQWTYMKQNDEVNVSNPSEEELQAINPYNFINIYKKGFKLSSKKVNNSYEVHLKATDKKRKIQEMYIIVDQNSYRPTHVKMQQNGKWSVLIISGLKATNLADGLFQFNAKDFPQAEIIDLR